jgi:three-Cys-motif partner protein
VVGITALYYKYGNDKSSESAKLDLRAPMPPEFRGDAIELSGLTGTKLKCDILGGYYPLWWSITSGGSTIGHPKDTAIVEMDAGSGEDCVKETGEIILGSSGHALNLKMTNPLASKLKVILVEKDRACFDHLKNVIRKRWSTLNLDLAEGPISSNRTSVYLIHQGLSEAVNMIKQIPLGNSLFFFDPLLYTPWSEIERVARDRITTYYQTGTEFIVFLFTSDWFSGRKNMNPPLAPLPTTGNANEWSPEESATVAKMNVLFGNENWSLLLTKPIPYNERIESLVHLYKNRLRRWFRYVLPLPFQPKPSQTYHLFVCSNFETGIRITRDFYTKFTNSPKFSPNNSEAFARFKKLHPEKAMNPTNPRKKSDEWHILWTIITDHEDGICDMRCLDLRRIQPTDGMRLEALKWLQGKGYLQTSGQYTDAWPNPPVLSRLDWGPVKQNLGIDRPPQLVPLLPSNSPNSLLQRQ